MRERGGGTWSERLAVRGAVREGGGGGTWSERLAVRGSSERRRRRRNMV